MFSPDNNMLHRAMLQHRIKSMGEEMSCTIREKYWRDKTATLRNSERSRVYQK